MNTIFHYITLAGVALAATLACTKENYGDAPKAWDETGEYFASADEKGFSTYYTPAIGRVGDPMPFYDSKAGDCICRSSTTTPPITSTPSGA